MANHLDNSEAFRFIRSDPKSNSGKISCLSWIPVRIILFVLRFYGPVNSMGSYRARSVYLTTLLLGRLSPLSGERVLCTFFRQKDTCMQDEDLTKQ